MERTRWAFLEEEPDACTVVTRGMELLYVNGSARALLPDDWYLRRCWHALPVSDRTCAARCPAVRAVATGGDVVYCEETLACADGARVPLGVAVIPVSDGAGDEARGDAASVHAARAILLLRPKVPAAEGAFEAALLADARRLRARGLRP